MTCGRRAETVLFSVSAAIYKFGALSATSVLHVMMEAPEGSHPSVRLASGLLMAVDNERKLY